MKSDSNKSVIRTFRPVAISSSMSAVGDVSPFMIRLTVDFDSPVMAATWRTDRSWLYMIFASRIFMPYIVTYKGEKDTGNYWKQKGNVVFKLTKETSTKKNIN